MIAKRSDESDRATELEEAERDFLVSQARRAARNPGIKPKGACHFCGEDVPEPRLFCDSDCADGFDKLQSARRRNGYR